MITISGGATLAALAFLGLVCAVVITGEVVIAIVIAIYVAVKHLRMPTLPDVTKGELIAYGDLHATEPTPPPPSPAREEQYDPALHLAPARRAFK